MKNIPQYLKKYIVNQDYGQYSSIDHACWRFIMRINKAYFSENLPHQLANTRRFVQDKLEDYAAYSNGNIHFEFIGDDEKIKEEAQKSGIQPLQVQV